MGIEDFATPEQLKKAYINEVPRNQNAGSEEAEAREKTTYGNRLFSQWSMKKSDEYFATFETAKTLRPGFYEIFKEQGIIYFKLKELQTDDLIKFPDSQMNEILNEISIFWEKVNTFKEYGFLHRRGYMFYGEAGSGKTCLAKLIINNLINHDGVVVNCNYNPNTINEALSNFRQVEPNRRIICLFEDLDAIIYNHGEETVLSLLDGENQINHVLNIATTNYPEKLDRRLISRPRRFDRIIKVDMPTTNMRSLFFKEKLKINGAELTKFVDGTNSFTFAAMSELVISIKCFDKSFEESIDIIKELLTAKRSSEEYYGDEAGF